MCASQLWGGCAPPPIPSGLGSRVAVRRLPDASLFICPSLLLTLFLISLWGSGDPTRCLIPMQSVIQQGPWWSGQQYKSCRCWADLMLCTKPPKAYGVQSVFCQWTCGLDRAQQGQLLSFPRGIIWGQTMASVLQWPRGLIALVWHWLMTVGVGFSCFPRNLSMCSLLVLRGLCHSRWLC